MSMWKVLLWHCHNKATVYFNPFIMTNNNPITGQICCTHCDSSLILITTVEICVIPRHVLLKHVAFYSKVLLKHVAFYSKVKWIR